MDYRPLDWLPEELTCHYPNHDDHPVELAVAP